MTMSNPKKVKALKPHMYGTRFISRGDVYRPQHPEHIPVLVRVGLCKEHVEEVKRETEEEPQVLPQDEGSEEVKPAPKKRARKKSGKNREKAEHDKEKQDD